MVSIPEKTLEDLEYDEVLRQCAAFAITPMGKEVVLGLKPQTDTEEVLKKLQMTALKMYPNISNCLKLRTLYWSWRPFEI
jgi:dsDNA-specific endonuclease/ATPase MutS2